MKDDWNDVHLRIDRAFTGMERIQDEQQDIKNDISKIQNEVFFQKIDISHIQNEVGQIRQEMGAMHDTILDIKNLLVALHGTEVNENNGKSRPGRLRRASDARRTRGKALTV